MLYEYSWGVTTRLTNTAASEFVALGYQFSRPYMLDSTNLTLTLQLLAPNVKQILLQLPSSLTLPSLPSLPVCSSPSPVSCTPNPSLSTVALSFTPPAPTPVTLTLGPLTTPGLHSLAYPPLVLSAYDQDGYLISRDTSTVVFRLLCGLPCRVCVGEGVRCTGCFGVGDGVTDRVYYLGEGGLGYGTCVAGCPGGYYHGVGVCLLCGTECRECQGDGSNCTRCYNSTYLYNSTCLDVCPDGAYPSALNPTAPSC